MLVATDATCASSRATAPYVHSHVPLSCLVRLQTGAVSKPAKMENLTRPETAEEMDHTAAKLRRALLVWILCQKTQNGTPLAGPQVVESDVGMLYHNLDHPCMYGIDANIDPRSAIPIIEGSGEGGCRRVLGSKVAALEFFFMLFGCALSLWPG